MTLGVRVNDFVRKNSAGILIQILTSDIKEGRRYIEGMTNEVLPSWHVYSVTCVLITLAK